MLGLAAGAGGSPLNLERNLPEPGISPDTGNLLLPSPCPPLVRCSKLQIREDIAYFACPSLSSLLGNSLIWPGILIELRLEEERLRNPPLFVESREMEEPPMLEEDVPDLLIWKGVASTDKPWLSLL